MQFAVFTGLTHTTWEEVLGLWRHVEATGWDAACVTDHFMSNTADAAGDTLECWTTLAALAAVVPRMRVGTIVSGNTYRHPAVLAKMATMVDLVSGGRLICGIGAGWQENEHRAYGIPFYTLRERLGRLDEACRVLKALWTEPRAAFHGRYYRLDDAPLEPKPVQQPHPELMVGGGGETGDAPDRRPPRRSLERLGRARDPRAEEPGPGGALRGGRPRPGHRAPVGQHAPAERRTPRIGNAPTASLSAQPSAHPTGD